MPQLESDGDFVRFKESFGNVSAKTNDGNTTRPLTEDEVAVVPEDKATPLCCLVSRALRLYIA